MPLIFPSWRLDSRAYSPAWLVAALIAACLGQLRAQVTAGQLDAR
jgi:hypothetical protein